jgi:hypothetical protein
MLAFLLFATLATAPAADAAPSETEETSTPSSREADNPNWKCATGRNRLRSQESRETWDQIKALKKDNGGGVPPEAQKILNEMTAFYEAEGDETSTDMAEMMREFAGGKAERRTAC